MKDKLQDRIHEICEGNAILHFLLSHGTLAFFYGVFLFLYEIKFLRQIVPVVHPVLIAWGGIIFLYDVLIRRLWRTLPFRAPVLLFIISSFMTVIVTREAGLIGNLKGWVLASLPLCVFYPVCVASSGEDRTKTLIKALLGAAVVSFAASLTAVIMFLFRFTRVVTIAGVTDFIGTRYYILDDPTSAMLVYGVYKDTNHAAIYALAFILISVVIFLFCRRRGFAHTGVNKVLSVFAVVSIAVQCCYFPLANSRGGWLSMTVTVLVVGFLLFFTRLFRDKKTAKKILLSIAASVAAAVVVFCGMLALRYGLSALSDGIHTMISDSGYAGDDIWGDDEEEWGESFEKDNTNLGAGRISIWLDVLSLFREKPILGEGHGNTGYYAPIYSPDGVMASRNPAVHNSYLDLLLDYGILGAVLLLSFWVACAVCIIKRMCTGNEAPDIMVYIIAAAVVTTACGALFLSCTFVSTTAMYFVMTVSAGYCVSACISDKGGENVK